MKNSFPSYFPAVLPVIQGYENWKMLTLDIFSVFVETVCHLFAKVKSDHFFLLVHI
jgi:hypothetical protein